MTKPKFTDEELDDIEGFKFAIKYEIMDMRADHGKQIVELAYELREEFNDLMTDHKERLKEFKEDIIKNREND